jgi:phospholipid N-methyltransferase
MAKKKSKPTRQQIVTKQLLKQQETNERLREKEINPNFFKLFEK